MGDEAVETGSWCGAAGADRDLGNRSRAVRQIAQDGRWRPAVMDACLVERSKTVMGVVKLGAKSGADQSKGGGWEGKSGCGG